MFWLHAVHQPTSAGNEDEVPTAWKALAEEETDNRRVALEGLVCRAACGQTLSLTSPESPASSSSRFKALERHNKLSITLGPHKFSWQGQSGRELRVPILFADVFTAPVPPSREKSRDTLAKYVIGLAPRPEKDPDAQSGKLPPLDSVWFVCIGNNSSDRVLQQVLFALGRRGALRWDLNHCYQLGTRPIGSGGCGKVYRAEKVTDLTGSPEEAQEVTSSAAAIAALPGEPDVQAIEHVAVKKLSRSFLQGGQASVRNEIELLCRARDHPNITALYGVFCFWEQYAADANASKESDGSDDAPTTHQLAQPRLRWAIVMGLCPNGDLHDFLIERGPLVPAACLEVLCGVLSALAHLHHLRIVHRDVKAENILLGEGARPILADLGIACFLDDATEMARMVGTPGYVAPEVVRKRPYGVKCDIFSAGVVLYFALSTHMPFHSDLGAQQVLSLTARCRIKYSAQHFQHVSGSEMSLLKMLLSKEPEFRPSAQKACLAVWKFTSAAVRESQAMQDAYAALPLNQEDKEPQVSPQISSEQPVQKKNSHQESQPQTPRRPSHLQPPMSLPQAAGRTLTSLAPEPSDPLPMVRVASNPNPQRQVMGDVKEPTAPATEKDGSRFFRRFFAGAFSPFRGGSSDNSTKETNAARDAKLQNVFGPVKSER